VIVDASALISVAREEPGFETYLEALLRSTANRVSAATFLEAAIVVDHLPNPRASVRFDQLIRDLEISIEPVTADQATIAREAYRRYGKGTGHPARLNFGDCFAYALAKELDEPLLFIGQDFVHTDVRRVLD
jgi:ribonuclease VapC